MASITIRNIEDSLKSRLRIQAAFHGRSMEDEARDILRSALNREPARPGNLAASIRARFRQVVESNCPRFHVRRSVSRRPSARNPARHQTSCPS